MNPSKKIDLFIIAAGKGSRMGGNIPKALLAVGGEICLTATLKNIGDKFDNVYVVTNNSIQDIWEDYFKTIKNRLDIYPNITNVPISSGLGDGHATLVALTNVYEWQNFYYLNDVVVCWGDVYFPNPELIDELIENKSSPTGVIPATKEDNPYVTLLVDGGMNCMSADFSKWGECHPNGFHDLSVFKFNGKLLYSKLNTLHDSFWKSGRYITPSGELSLLYTFHSFFNDSNEAAPAPLKVYESDYTTYSFNTPEEVFTIEEKIGYKL